MKFSNILYLSVIVLKNRISCSFTTHSFISKSSQSYFLARDSKVLKAEKSTTKETDKEVETETKLPSELHPGICKKLCIHVCSSTSCTKKRKLLMMDEFATFGAMYERSGQSGIEVEEAPCLGSCKLAPCVAISHEDYEGFIGLEGMTDQELSLRRYINVITEGDCDRVFDHLENAIFQLSEEEDGN